MHHGTRVRLGDPNAEPTQPTQQHRAEQAESETLIGLVDGQPPLFGVPFAIDLVLMIDERVHHSHMHREPEPLARAAQPVVLGDRRGPVHRLPHAPKRSPPREQTGFDKQIGRTPEAITADEGQIGHDVSDVRPVAAIGLGAGVDQVEVHPLGGVLHHVEERSQRIRAIGHRINPRREGGVELAHGDPGRIS